MNKKKHFNQSLISILLASLLFGLSGCERFQSAETLVEKANAALAKADKDTAIIHLKNALQKSPDNGQARFLLGQALVEKRDYFPAEKELRRARELNIDPNKVLPLLSKALFFTQNFKGLSEIEAAKLTDRKAQAEVLAWQANSYLQTEKLKQASDLFDQSAQIDPESVTALFGQALVATANGQADKAESLLQKILRIAPKDVNTLVYYAEMEKRRNNEDKALQLLNAAIAADPKDVRPYQILGMSALSKNNLDEALKQADLILKSDANSPIGYNLKALVESRKQNLKAAQAEIQKALKAAPGFLPSLMLAATIEFSLGSYGQTEQYLKQILGKYPANRPAGRLMAQTLMRTQRSDKAIEMLLPLVEATPNDVELRTLLGEAYLQIGEFKKSNEQFQHASSVDSKNKGAATGAALARMAAGDPNGAINELESAVKIQSDGIQPDLVLISARIQRGEYDKAEESIKQLEAKLPNSPITHTLRANLAMLKKDIPQARQHYEQALKLDPKYFLALQRLVQLDQVAGKNAEAEKRLQDFLAKQDKHVDATILLADLKASQNASVDEVVSLLKRAQSADPTQYRASEVLVRYLLSQKKTKEALEAAQQALAASPDSPQLLNMLGNAYMLLDRANEAVTIFRKLTALQPKNVQAWVKQAQAHMVAGEKAAAVNAISRAYELNPGNSELLEAAVQYRIADNRIDEAIALARDVQKKNPESPVGYVVEADALIIKQQYSDAITRYDQALKLKADPNIVIRKYQGLIKGKRDADAEKALLDWIKQSPKDTVVRAFAGDIALRRGNRDAALNYYRAVIEINPQHVAALNNIAWILNERKDANAMQYIERALKVQPNSAAALDTKGTILLDQGKFEAAVLAFQEAAQNAPTQPDIRLNYAKALLKAGQKEKARIELDALRKIGDKYPRAKEVQELARQLG